MEDKENNLTSPHPCELGLEQFDESIRKTAGERTRSYLKRRSVQSVKKPERTSQSQSLNGFKLRLQMRIDSINKRNRGEEKDKQLLIAEIDDNQRVLIKSLDELQKLKFRLSQDR